MAGGLYMADSVLRGGRVAMYSVENKVIPEWTEAVREHNELIAEDRDYDCSIPLPL